MDISWLELDHLIEAQLSGIYAAKQFDRNRHFEGARHREPLGAIDEPYVRFRGESQSRQRRHLRLVPDEPFPVRVSKDGVLSLRGICANA